jgi:arylsulfatase
MVLRESAGAPALGGAKPTSAGSLDAQGGRISGRTKGNPVWLGRAERCTGRTSAEFAERRAETHAYRNFAGDWPDHGHRNRISLSSESAGGAPKIVVILCDEVGYSDFGCFGSEIPTPNIDRLVEEGLRYTNFHVMPMCSPTRAALLTGRNAHAAGVGWVAHADPGFPGYAMELPEDVKTFSETLRDQE